MSRLANDLLEVLQENDSGCVSVSQLCSQIRVRRTERLSRYWFFRLFGISAPMPPEIEKAAQHLIRRQHPVVCTIMHGTTTHVRLVRN